MSFMEYTSDQIIFLRSHLGLSQEAFAKSISYSRSYVKDIESGRVKPSRAFLEALSSKYGVSIDALLSNLGTQILAGLNAHFLTSEGGFIYLYDFTNSGLDIAEKKLLKFLNDTGKKYKVMDGRKIKGIREFYSELFGWKKQGVSYRPPTQNDISTYTGDLDFIILKRFSESPIQRQMWGIYRGLFYYMRGSLIVIDKPSHLEKYIEYLYHSAFPIHVKDAFGFVNRP
jgi:transcriptional regulator with XRE-family HTH domain